MQKKIEAYIFDKSKKYIKIKKPQKWNLFKQTYDGAELVVVLFFSDLKKLVISKVNVGLVGVGPLARAKECDEQGP